MLSDLIVSQELLYMYIIQNLYNLKNHILKSAIIWLGKKNTHLYIFLLHKPVYFPIPFYYFNVTEIWSN